MMMKWKARKETTDIGVLELGNVTFNEDFMEVSIDICSMSDELKAEVDKAIEIEKARYSKECKEFKRDVFEWSDKPVVIECAYLAILLQANEPIKYTIDVCFHDAENERLEPVCSLNVDLSDYSEELKKAIIKVLIDRFF